MQMNSQGSPVSMALRNISTTGFSETSNGIRGCASHANSPSDGNNFGSRPGSLISKTEEFRLLFILETIPTGADIRWGSPLYNRGIWVLPRPRSCASLSDILTDII